MNELEPLKYFVYGYLTDGIKGLQAAFAYPQDAYLYLTSIRKSYPDITFTVEDKDGNKSSL